MLQIIAWPGDIAMNLNTIGAHTHIRTYAGQET
jgi:hypothetical protein